MYNIYIIYIYYTYITIMILEIGPPPTFHNLSMSQDFGLLFEAWPGLLLEVAMCTALHPRMGSGPGKNL